MMLKSCLYVVASGDEDEDECGNNLGSQSAPNELGDLSAGTRSSGQGPTTLQLQHQQFLGDASLVVLDFASVKVDDNELLPEGITIDHLNVFEEMYYAHCQVVSYVCASLSLATAGR